MSSCHLYLVFAKLGLDCQNHNKSKLLIVAMKAITDHTFFQKWLTSPCSCLELLHDSLGKRRRRMRRRRGKISLGQHAAVCSLLHYCEKNEMRHFNHH
jgi:hypothetical protein